MSRRFCKKPSLASSTVNFFACELPGRDFLHCGHLVMLSTNGFIQIARVKAYAQLVGFDNDQHTADWLGWFNYIYLLFFLVTLAVFFFCHTLKVFVSRLLNYVGNRCLSRPNHGFATAMIFRIRSKSGFSCQVFLINELSLFSPTGWEDSCFVQLFTAR